MHDEMTLTDAAKLLGIDRSVMRRAMRRHNMQHRKLGERLIVIKRDDVETYGRTRRSRPRRGLNTSQGETS